MVKVGDQLPYPEEGWIRFDDRDENITYEGSDWSVDRPSESLAWSGTMSHSSSSDAKIKFNFIGDRIRIIARTYSNRSNQIQIKINNKIVDVFSEYSSTTISFVVVYENLNLDFGEHFVEISNLSTGRLLLDAIDIHAEGALLPYNENVAFVKSFIYHNGEYKKYSGNEWRTVSSSLPNKQLFQDEGMNDLLILNRRKTNFEVVMLPDNSSIEQKIYKGEIDLKKNIEIININYKY